MLLSKTLCGLQIKTWRRIAAELKKTAMDSRADCECYFQGRKCMRMWVRLGNIVCLDIFGVVVLGRKRTANKMSSHLSCEQSVGSAL